MNNRLKFKLISHSSQQPEHPASSILFPTSTGWQSKRFCSYPQELTLQFYGLAMVEKIEIVIPGRRVPSQIDLLYYGGDGQERFKRYGVIQFGPAVDGRGYGGTLGETKIITLNLKCIYLRLLFRKPIPTPENFFTQVGLQQIVVYGTEGGLTPLSMDQQASAAISNTMPMGDGVEDPFIMEKLAELTQLKDQAVMDEDFDSANQYKDFISKVKKFNDQLTRLQKQKQLAIANEDYDLAKQLKQKIQINRTDIRQILGETVAVDKPYFDQTQVQGNQFVDEPQQQQQQQSSTISSRLQMKDSKVIAERLKQSRQANGGSSSRLNLLGMGKSEVKQIPYDDRVIPKLALSKVKAEEEQIIQPEKVEVELEEVDGKYAKDAAQLQPFLDQMSVKQFFSKHWQNKVKALTKIKDLIPSLGNDPAYMRCLVMVARYCVDEANLQVSQNVLSVLFDLLEANNRSNAISKAEHFNDLDTIGRDVVRRLSDNNQKIRGQSERIFQAMAASNLFGIELSYGLLIKDKGKAAKQVISRMIQLTRMASKYGAPPNIIPQAALGYGFEQLNHQSGEVKETAINFLAVCLKNNEAVARPKLKNIRQAVRTQIQNRAAALDDVPQPKPKKK